MRLLCCTDTYPPEVNGVAIVTALSLEGLAARGWDVAFVTGARENGAAPTAIKRTTYPSVPVPIYPELRIALVRGATIEHAARAFAPDLIHCATEFVVGRHGMRAAERLDIPAVTSYHTNFARYTRSYGLGFIERSIEASITRFHRRARRTYTPSAPSREYLRALGVPNVEVWGRGVDLRLFRPAKKSAELRRTLGIGHAFAFLHVGRLAAEKDIPRILEAFRLVQESEGPASVRLIVAGRGPVERDLRRAAPDGVTFLGALDRARELPALYASADAFVFASLTETLGLVVLEAMASGLPVIAIPAGGVADHLRDGENGIAVPQGDAEAMARAMRAMVHDHALRQRLARGALATAAHLDWERELDRLDVSYRMVLEHRNGH